MIRSLEASLERLKTDYVDVFMPHFPDGITPIQEIMAGFDDLNPVRKDPARRVVQFRGLAGRRRGGASGSAWAGPADRH